MINYLKNKELFFPRLLKHAVLDQPTVHSGRVSRGRSVVVAVGCWLFVLQWHLNGTSTAPPWHFNGTSMALSWHFHGNSTSLPWPCQGKQKVLSASVKTVSVYPMRDFVVFVFFVQCGGAICWRVCHQWGYPV